MKKFVLILVCALALFGGQAHAQRYLPKMRGIEFRGGVVDGFTNPSNHYAGIAISTYTKSKDRWVLGAEYMQKMYDYKEVQIPKVQFTAVIICSYPTTRSRYFSPLEVQLC